MIAETTVASGAGFPRVANRAVGPMAGNALLVLRSALRGRDGIGLFSVAARACLALGRPVVEAVAALAALVRTGNRPRTALVHGGWVAANAGSIGGAARAVWRVAALASSMLLGHRRAQGAAHAMTARASVAARRGDLGNAVACVAELTRGLAMQARRFEGPGRSLPCTAALGRGVAATALLIEGRDGANPACEGMAARAVNRRPFHAHPRQVCLEVVVADPAAISRAFPPVLSAAVATEAAFSRFPVQTVPLCRVGEPPSRVLDPVVAAHAVVAGNDAVGWDGHSTDHLSPPEAQRHRLSVAVATPQSLVRLTGACRHPGVEMAVRGAEADAGHLAADLGHSSPDQRRQYAHRNRAAEDAAPALATRYAALSAPRQAHDSPSRWAVSSPTLDSRCGGGVTAMARRSRDDAIAPAVSRLSALMGRLPLRGVAICVPGETTRNRSCLSSCTRNGAPLARKFSAAGIARRSPPAASAGR
jgi:hypothetical protein